MAPRAALGQANELFPSKAAAEKRAKDLKCDGALAMGKGGMTCQNFEVYMGRRSPN